MNPRRAFHLVLAAVSLGALGCAHGHSHPGPRAGAGGHRGVSVVGIGEVRAKPDIARAQVGVEVRAAQLEHATKQAEERMAAVVGALKAAGVADSDLRTQSLSVNFERDYQPPPPPVPMPVEPSPAKPRRRANARLRRPRCRLPRWRPSRRASIA